MCECSVVQSDTAAPWTEATRLLYPWNFPGENTGVGCHFQFQEIFPTQQWKLHLLYLLLAAAAAAAKSLQSCLTLCDPIDGSPTGSPRPWDSPGKNTGVGCHFLLQCMKVKSESEVLQSCRTLHNPMDCSPSGSSIYGIFQARVLEWGAITFSEISCLGNLKSYSSFQFPNFYWAS